VLIAVRATRITRILAPPRSTSTTGRKRSRPCNQRLALIAPDGKGLIVNPYNAFFDPTVSILSQVCRCQKVPSRTDWEPSGLSSVAAAAPCWLPSFPMTTAAAKLPGPRFFLAVSSPSPQPVNDGLCIGHISGCHINPAVSFRLWAGQVSSSGLRLTLRRQVSAPDRRGVDKLVRQWRPGF